MKLNLPCGADYREGWVNADLSPNVRTDVRMNALEFPYAFEDDSFDEVLVAHFIEHVPPVVPGHPDRNGMLLFIEELYRIARPNAVIEFRFPHYRSRHAWIDPTHTRVVDPRMFDYFTPGHHLNFYSHARFDVLSVRHTRELTIGRWFNSNYHIPKYLHVRPDVGWKKEVIVRVRVLKGADALGTGSPKSFHSGCA